MEYMILALRALRINKIRSILTMLGIIIGVASVILLVSIGTGIQAYVTNQFTSLGSNKIFVLPGKVDLKQLGGRPTSPVSKFILDDVVSLSRASEGISAVTPTIVQNGTIAYQGKIIPIEIAGVWENYFQISNFVAEKGSILTQNDVERSRKVIVLGSKPAKDLFGDIEPVGKSVTIGEIRYSVKGTLVSKGGEGELGIL